MKKLLSLWITVVIILFQVQVSEACTGITLTTKDNSMILARTIEWGGSDLNSQYVVVPRGYEQYSYIPGGERSGMKFTARYGYIGLSVEQKEFVAEGDVRWLDMKRLGVKTERTIGGETFKLNGYEDYRYAFPIPLSEINNNKYIEQNPGWILND